MVSGIYKLIFLYTCLLWSFRGSAAHHPAAVKSAEEGFLLKDKKFLMCYVAPARYFQSSINWSVVSYELTLSSCIIGKQLKKFLGHEIPYIVYATPYCQFRVLVNGYLLIYEPREQKFKKLDGNPFVNTSRLSSPHDLIPFILNGTQIDHQDARYFRAPFLRSIVGKQFSQLGIGPRKQLNSICFDTRFPHYETLVYGGTRVSYDWKTGLFGFLEQSSTGTIFKKASLAQLCKALNSPYPLHVKR